MHHNIVSKVKCSNSISGNAATLSQPVDHHHHHHQCHVASSCNHEHYRYQPIMTWSMRSYCHDLQKCVRRVGWNINCPRNTFQEVLAGKNSILNEEKNIRLWICHFSGELCMQLQLEGCTLHCSALQYYLHSIVCNTLEPKIYNKSLHSATFTRHHQHRCCAVLRWFQKIDVHKIIQLGAPPFQFCTTVQFALLQFWIVLFGGEIELCLDLHCVYWMRGHKFWKILESL